MFSIIPKHNDTYVPYWKRHKNSTVAVGSTTVLQVQCSVQLQWTLQCSWYSDPSVFQNQFAHSCCIHTPFTAQPLSQMSMLLFWNSLYWIFIKLLLHTSSNGGKFWWLKRVLLTKPNHTTNFFTGPQFQSCWHCTSTYPLNSIQVPDLCHLLLLPPQQVQPLTKQQTQMLQARKPCPWGMPCKIW